jgi:hypothetical protein
MHISRGRMKMTSPPMARAWPRRAHRGREPQQHLAAPKVAAQQRAAAYNAM